MTLDTTTDLESRFRQIAVRVRTAREDYEAHAITEEQLLIALAAAVEELAGS